MEEKTKTAALKILFVMPTHISFGGIERVAISLWKGLIQRGYMVDFVCHGKQLGSYEKEIIESGSKVYHIPAKGKHLVGTICEFQKILEKTKYDVVHAHMNATSGIYLQMANKHGVPVLAAHSHASSMKAFTKNPINAFVNEFEKARTKRYANVKIACSDLAGKWLFGEDSYSVIINPVDTEAFCFTREVREKKRKELGLNDKSIVLLHVGDFLNYKNHLYLIDVFQTIRAKRKDAKLILIGDGPLRKTILKKIKECVEESSVLLLGHRNDVNEIMQAADVFLLPSLSEGNPVALSEAAVAGMRCLVSDTVARDTARYFKKESIEFLPINKDALTLWAKKAIMPWKRISYSDTNLSRISIESFIEQTLSLYEDILDKQGLK